MGLPWFKFYSTDWFGNPNLRSCSAAARALWIDMMCIMHEANPYGHLLISGKRMMLGDLAKIARMHHHTVAKALVELEEKGIIQTITISLPLGLPSTLPQGLLPGYFSSKMIRTEEKRKKNQSNGRKGANVSGFGRPRPETRGQRYKKEEPVDNFSASPELMHYLNGGDK